MVRLVYYSPIFSWTPYPTVIGGHGTQYYASSTLGNNAWSGTLPVPNAGQTDGPKKTIYNFTKVGGGTSYGGRSLMADNKSDQLLLACGDSFSGDATLFTDGPGDSFGRWICNGYSATEPQVIGVYQPQGVGWPYPPFARARIFLSDGANSDPRGSGLIVQGGGGTPASVRNVQMHNLELIGDPSSGGSNGISFLKECSNWLFEDVKIAKMRGNAVNMGGWPGEPLAQSNISFRGCIFRDSWLGAGHETSGLFFADTQGLNIEGCISYHEGWGSAGQPGTTQAQCQGIYISETHDNGFSTASGVSLTDSIICHPGSGGAQLRSGGIAYRNCFLDVPIGLATGAPGLPGPVTVEMVGNLFHLSHDYDMGFAADFGGPRGKGLLVSFLSGGHIRRNMFLNSGTATLGTAIELYGHQYGTQCQGVSVSGNLVRNWVGSSQFGIYTDATTPFNLQYDVASTSADGAFSGTSITPMSPTVGINTSYNIGDYAREYGFTSHSDNLRALADLMEDACNTSQAYPQPDLTSAAIRKRFAYMNGF